MNKTNIIVIPPETAEVSDEEEGNDDILNNDNDILPHDTVKIEVCIKKKSEHYKVVQAMGKLLTLKLKMDFKKRTIKYDSAKKLRRR